MARSDKRYMVYPAEKATEIIGTSAPMLNQAIECWGAQLARATAKNAQEFWVTSWDHLATEEIQNPLHEWGVIARALKGRRFDPEYANPGELLGTAVEDFYLLDRFTIESSCFSPRSYQKGEARKVEVELDEAMKTLTQRLRSLDYVRSWAVIWAVQWYWEHSESVELAGDDWWTFAYRRAYRSQPVAKQEKKRRLQN